jgi:hypothetical protein
MTVVGDLGRRALHMARHGRPPEWDADFARRMAAAREVSDGTAEAVHVAAWLSGPRRSHALVEGIEHVSGVER